MMWQTFEPEDPRIGSWPCPWLWRWPSRTPCFHLLRIGSFQSFLLAIDSRRTRQIESLRRRFQFGLSLTQFGSLLSANSFGCKVEQPREKKVRRSGRFPRRCGALISPCFGLGLRL